MDGEHGFDTPHRVPTGGHILEIDGHQRRLPVVAVDHIRHPVQTGHQIHHRLAEKGKAFAVVVLAVQAAPAEIVLVVHEIPRHATVLHDEQSAVLVPPRHIHIDIAAVHHPLAPLLGDLIVQRQDHRHLIAVLGQGYRQTAGHVRKTARLAEGKRLTGGKQYFHKSSSSLWLAKNLAIFLPIWLAADCARPSDTLAAENYFSDVHAAGKIIRLFRRLRAANSARLTSPSDFAPVTVSCSSPPPGDTGRDRPWPHRRRIPRSCRR